MRPLITLTCQLITLWLCSIAVQADKDADRAEGRKPLKAVNIKYMLRTYCRASSKIVDEKAFGGFGPSENHPRPLNKTHAKLKLPSGKLTLLALPSSRVPFWKKYEGFRLLLVNKTGQRIAILAQDSAVNIIREARDAKGKWRPLEYMPGTFCGNSYHRVMFDTNQHWEFTVPRYSGSVKTQMRFRVSIGRQAKPIYSNTFEGSINVEQFSVKQAYKRKSLMDPRTD